MRLSLSSSDPGPHTMSVMADIEPSARSLWRLNMGASLALITSLELYASCGATKSGRWLMSRFTSEASTVDRLEGDCVHFRDTENKVFCLGAGSGVTLRVFGENDAVPPRRESASLGAAMVAIDHGAADVVCAELGEVERRREPRTYPIVAPVSDVVDDHVGPLLLLAQLTDCFCAVGFRGRV